MVTKEIKARYSCKRKSDFMTYFAIYFFLLVVVFELYLIVWVPIQLKREDVLQKHVAKENLVTLVDTLRSEIGRIGTAASLNKGEVELTRTVLDHYALYIREHQDALDFPQIIDLYKMLNRYQAVIEQWKARQFSFRKETLDLPAAYQYLEKKNHL